MSIIYELPKEYAKPKPKCFACGGEPSAFWCGANNKIVAVCAECSVTALPSLIADAAIGVNGFNSGWRVACDRTVSKINERFWWAIAAAMLRQGFARRTS